MMKNKHNISQGCSEWHDRLTDLMKLTEGQPEFDKWIEHAKGCELCQVVLDGELTLRTALADLPDPGPAYVAGKVMSRVRTRSAATGLFRRGEIALGMAGSLVGVLIGIWLAGSMPDTSRIQSSESLDAIASLYSDEMDEAIWSLLVETNGDRP